MAPAVLTTFAPVRARNFSTMRGIAGRTAEKAGGGAAIDHQIELLVRNGSMASRVASP